MSQYEHNQNENHNDVDNDEDESKKLSNPNQERIEFFNHALFDKRMLNAKGNLGSYVQTYDLANSEDKTRLENMIDVMASYDYNVHTAPQLIGEKFASVNDGTAALQIMTVKLPNGKMRPDGKPVYDDTASGVIVNYFAPIMDMLVDDGAGAYKMFVTKALNELVMKSCRNSIKSTVETNDETGEVDVGLTVSGVMPFLPSGIFAVTKNSSKKDIRDAIGMFIVMLSANKTIELWKGLKQVNFLRSLKSKSYALAGSHGAFETQGKFAEFLHAVDNFKHKAGAPAYLRAQLAKVFEQKPEKLQSDEYNQEAIELFFATDWAKDILNQRNLYNLKVAATKLSEKENEHAQELAAFGL